MHLASAFHGLVSAVSRVSNYSSPIVRMGGTYCATDLGSATLVDLILRNPTTPFGRIFEMGNGFSVDALRRFAHPDGGVAEGGAWAITTASSSDRAITG